jgi:hypothetical protein
LLDGLPHGKTFNAEYYLDNILIAVIQLCLQIDGKQLVLYADRAKPLSITFRE